MSNLIDNYYNCCRRAGNICKIYDGSHWKRLAPNMAATRIWDPLLLAILINFKLQFYIYIFLNEDLKSLKSILRGNSSFGSDDFGISMSGCKFYSTRARRHGRIQWPITKWVKHGYVLLAETDYSLSPIDTLLQFTWMWRGTLAPFLLRRAICKSPN